MESRKRKRSPCKDRKENEKLPIRKIAKREKCVPILPDEIWTMIFGYLDTVTIHTKVSIVCKYFFDLVRNNSKLAGELKISPKYVENVFKLNKAGLSLLSYDLNSNMEEMLKRWPKIETVKFTGISAFEKTEWLRNLSKTNLEKNIFYQFKVLKDFQKAWKTETLKKVVLVKLGEKPEGSYHGCFMELNTSKKQAEKTLQYGRWALLPGIHLVRVVQVLAIQYDCINVTNYDAIRDIRFRRPSKEAMQFMAKEMKNLEHLQVITCKFSNFLNELLSKDWQKAFCDFLKSQEQTLVEVTLLVCPDEGELDYTKLIYDSINKFCPNVHTVNTVTFH